MQNINFDFCHYSNLRRNLLWVSNWLSLVPRPPPSFPSLAVREAGRGPGNEPITGLQNVTCPIAARREPVPPQFGIGWKELLGHVPQVPVSAPSGSANDYTGFIPYRIIHTIFLPLYKRSAIWCVIMYSLTV